MKLPDWLSEETATALKTQYGSLGRLVPITTELGGVVLRPPSREAILEYHPAPLKNAEARGMLTEDESSLDRDADLAMAAICYPDRATVQQYLAKKPMLAPYLASHAKVMATGFKGEMKGLPTDLQELSALSSIDVSAYQIFVDISPDRLVLRAPSADAIRQWEVSRKRQSGIIAAETFTLSCLLAPTTQTVMELFKLRPLLGLYCASRLATWGLGEVEEFEGGF